MYAIRTFDLTKRFGTFTANNQINLAVKQQEIKCIVGENGAGKSTLMNMLYGLLSPTAGAIFVNDVEARFQSPIEAIARGLGMVHQHFKLVPSLTVYENILLGVEIKRKGMPFVDNKKEIEAVRNLIAKYKFELDPLEKVENISVGAMQRVEILKMLYRNVGILILDEPTAVLTPSEVDELISNLKELKKQGKTIIVITHKLREVMELSDSITVIKRGKIVAELITHDTNEAEIAQKMVGRDVVLTVHNEGGKKISDEVVFQTQGLSTINDYGREVISDISLKIRKGEILGIAGVEGNGQSELIKVITGTMKASAGIVRLMGADVTNRWPDELRKKGMGIIPEDRYAQGLCKSMSIADNAVAGYHDSATVCHCGILSRKKISEKRDRLIEAFDIRVSDKNASIGSLSGGNAQKVIIAREFDAKPVLLIACQPTRGVDIGSIEYIHSQIVDFAKQGNAVLLISSELSEVLSLSDRVNVMYKGKIIGECRTSEKDKIGLCMAGVQG